MVEVSHFFIQIMINESISATPSGSGTLTSVSENRPVVMPESFAALDSKEWDSWISHLEDCTVINGWSDGRKVQFLIICMHGAALLQLQSLGTSMGENYAELKEALQEKFVPKESVKLHKAEFCARHRE